MKKSIYLLMIWSAILLTTACNKKIAEVHYTPEITISFQGVGDSNIVKVGKGVMDYTAKIDVKAGGTQFTSFEIYAADAKTGIKGALIAGTAKAFESGQQQYSSSLAIQNLVENKCIKVMVTDTIGRVFEKNLVVKITPSVIFSMTVPIETVENYYGPYFANWLTGRVYMRKHEAYKNEIDFSLGDVILPSDGAAIVPALVSPAKRGNFNLLTIPGLQATQFELTNLTPAQYNGVTQVDETLIASLPDPTQDAVMLTNNKVYVYKTANNKKGLILVTGLARKTATIETEPGKWVPGTSYFSANISSKVIVR